MSRRLLRGSRKQRVLVSATAMNLPADPGFLVEKEVDEPFMEEKENGFVPVMPVHKRTEKPRGLSTLNPLGFSVLLCTGITGTNPFSFSSMNGSSTSFSTKNPGSAGRFIAVALTKTLCLRLDFWSK